jgi:8-oxo-dGTP diphosphatase
MASEIYYRGVSAIPINPEGKILLQQRDDRPDLLYPGHWTTFGGAIEGDETPDRAMRRELLEEIELDLPMKLWKVEQFVLKIGEGELPGENFIYVGRIDRPAEAITLNEGQALGYFALEDLDHLKIGFDFGSLFREVFAALAEGTLPLGAEA